VLALEVVVSGSCCPAPALAVLYQIGHIVRMNPSRLDSSSSHGHMLISMTGQC
jgi:hypothetical protein